jgi:hypothetical protein
LSILYIVCRGYNALDRSMTSKQLIEKNVARALGKYAKTYSIFKSECSIKNIKLNALRSSDLVSYDLYLSLLGVRSCLQTAIPTEQH